MKLSPDESMAMIEHLQAEIVELKGLTLRELIVIQGYRAGTPVGEIGRRAGICNSTVAQTACRLRQRGIDIPRGKCGLSIVHPRQTYPRFTATGITPEGCPTTVTSDTQAYADSFLAAMEARDAS